MQHLSMIVWNEELKNDTLLNIKDVLFKEEYVYCLILKIIWKRLQKYSIIGILFFLRYLFINFYRPLSILKEGITLIGFQGLMHKYIKNGRRDIPWDMIRYFFWLLSSLLLQL